MSDKIEIIDFGTDRNRGDKGLTWARWYRNGVIEIIRDSYIPDDVRRLIATSIAPNYEVTLNELKGIVDSIRDQIAQLEKYKQQP